MDSLTKKCTKCGEVKPLEAFNKISTGVLGRSSCCRECVSLRPKFSVNVSEKICPSCKLIKPASSYYTNPGNKDGLQWSCKDCYRDRRYSKKRRIIAHYTNGSNQCACCGESTFEFLTIDHVKGGGSNHRKQIRTSIIPYLIRNNFPPGYQILCFNCNCAKGFYGYCPHEKVGGRLSLETIPTPIDK